MIRSINRQGQRLNICSPQFVGPSGLVPGLIICYELIILSFVSNYQFILLVNGTPWVLLLFSSLTTPKLSAFFFLVPPRVSAPLRWAGRSSAKTEKIAIKTKDCNQKKRQRKKEKKKKIERPPKLVALNARHDCAFLTSATWKYLVPHIYFWVLLFFVFNPCSYCEPPRTEYRVSRSFTYSLPGSFSLRSFYVLFSPFNPVFLFLLALLRFLSFETASRKWGSFQFSPIAPFPFRFHLKGTETSMIRNCFFVWKIKTSDQLCFWIGVFHNDNRSYYSSTAGPFGHDHESGCPTTL